MSSTARIIDLSDRIAKAKLQGVLAGLQGPHRISIEKHRPRRSLKANAFYHAAVIPALQSFMRGNGQYFDHDEIHEFLLARFAGKNVIDPNTGKVLAVVGTRSSKMDVEQFATFVDHCIGWMQDRLGIPIPEPEYRAVAER